MAESSEPWPMTMLRLGCSFSASLSRASYMKNHRRMKSNQRRSKAVQVNVVEVEADWTPRALLELAAGVKGPCFNAFIDVGAPGLV